MEPIRQTAYKLWIKDIVDSSYVIQQGEWEPNYIEVKNKQISRVNLIANVVIKYVSEDKNHIFIVLDDGSSTIRVKTWNENIRLLKNIEVGDIVLVIGRVRQFNDEIYILPEIVKKLDNLNWELVRKLELLKLYGKPKIEEKSHVVVEEKGYGVETITVETVNNSLRQKILSIVEKLETEEGADFNEVINSSNITKEESMKIISDLIKSGEVFEPKPGKLKLIG